MSTEQYKAGPGEVRSPLHEDVSFETRDVETGPILKFLVILAVVVFFSFGLSLGFYKGLKTYWMSTYDMPAPSRTDMSPIMPPEPMLQGMPGHFIDPQQDMRNKVTEDVKANEELRWVDEKAGIVQIPVKEAMKLIAEKGLPGVAASPAGKK